jgi:uncharacterized UPF0160 family protein
MRIMTHNGPFHADDIVGVANALYFVSLGTTEAEDQPKIVRTRDRILLEDGLEDMFTIMVDVGGVYNPEMLNFDHHFVGSPIRENGDPYAAAGLTAEALHVSDGLDELCRRVDLADNGIHQEGWTLSTTIHKCNPLDGNFDTRFNYLVKLALEELIYGVSVYGCSIEDAVGRFENDWQVKQWVSEHNEALAASGVRVKAAFQQEGPIVELARYEPALFEIAHLAPGKKVYTIFPNPGGEWMVQQIPLEEKSPKGRKPLPEHWAGKRGAELEAVTGLPGSVFCHSTRFIGGHKTLDGAREMAMLAISL